MLLVLALAALLVGCPGSTPPLQMALDLGSLAINPGGNTDPTGRVQGYVYVPSIRGVARQAAQAQIGDSPVPPEGFAPAVAAEVNLVSVAGAPVAAQTTKADENGYFFFDGLDIGVGTTVNVRQGDREVLADVARSAQEFDIRGFRVIRIDMETVAQYQNNLDRMTRVDSMALSGDVGAVPVDWRCFIYTSDRGDLTRANVAQGTNAVLNYDIQYPANRAWPLENWHPGNLDRLDAEMGRTDADHQMFLYFLIDPPETPVIMTDLSLTFQASLGTAI